MIRTFEGITPVIAASTFIDDTAVVIGNVTIGEHSSIWPTVVIRGDVNTITVGDRTSIQDGSVLHVNHDADYNPGGDPLTIGSDVTVGHRVMLHGCTIQDHCLIGMSSTILDQAVVESHTMIGAGSLVSPGKTLESGYLYMGTPARQVRKLTDEELAYIDYAAQYYARLKEKHRVTDVI
ncbi:MAG: gamma carbonic anhydrase family protein [Gammaproteobacteria bacterium]|nr:gamma carbonic anhydrase family protein [Gammaproteobacteria bacterium]